MSKSNKNIVGVRVRSLALAVAAVVAGSAAVGRAAPIIATPGTTTGVNDVSKIGVERDLGNLVSAGTVTGVGGSGAAFKAGNSYTVKYGNNINKVETITAGGTTFAAQGFADNVIRRYTGANNDIVWENGSKTGTTSGSTITNDGVAVRGDHEVFDLNADNMGADNIFSTITGTGGNPAGNNTNVSRVDLLFRAGITSSAKSSVFIADRGNVGKHDPFAIAAVTALGVDANGDPVPTSFGQVLKFNAFTWGNVALDGSPENVILRTNNDLVNDPLHPADDQTEGIGGVSITTAELAGGAGQTIYGWALIDPMLNVSGNGSGTQLNNWKNENIYSHADFNNTGGGLDPAATLAVLYVAVPEPTTLAIAAMAAAPLLLGRRRRATLA